MTATKKEPAPVPVPVLFTPDQVHLVTRKSKANIETSLPLLFDAMAKHKIDKPQGIIATLATVASECDFLPVNEYGGEAYFIKMYFQRERTREALGNLTAEDAVKFHGRGFVQLTGRHNYEKYGKKIGIDLLKNPEKANEPGVAAQLLCVYLRDHGVDVWAGRGHWMKCRQLVNGGLNNFPYFEQCVYKFLDIAKF